jgi:glyoxalase/bleomycin resistance protein/dioxygenase superfamily protein
MITGMDASNLRSIEAKAFLPARDFELSKRFYQAVGFTLIWSTADLAYFRHDRSCFLLQNFFDAALARNFKMHLWVEDVDQWWRHITAAVRSFGIAPEPPEDRPWGMRDFPLVDPSGVFWRIGQPIAEDS